MMGMTSVAMKSATCQGDNKSREVVPPHTAYGAIRARSEEKAMAGLVSSGELDAYEAVAHPQTPRINHELKVRTLMWTWLTQVVPATRIAPVGSLAFDRKGKRRGHRDTHREVRDHLDWPRKV
jgi:hypothetical protein